MLYLAGACTSPNGAGSELLSGVVPRWIARIVRVLSVPRIGLSDPRRGRRSERIAMPEGTALEALHSDYGLLLRKSPLLLTGFVRVIDRHTGIPTPFQLQFCCRLMWRFDRRRRQPRAGVPEFLPVLGEGTRHENGTARFRWSRHPLRLPSIHRFKPQIHGFFVFLIHSPAYCTGISAQLSIPPAHSATDEYFTAHLSHVHLQPLSRDRRAAACPSLADIARPACGARRGVRQRSRAASFRREQR